MCTRIHPGTPCPAPTADNESKREEVLHSLHKMLQLMQFACAERVKCIFCSISTSPCTRVLSAFRPVSWGLNCITGLSSSCNRRVHVLLRALHFH